MPSEVAVFISVLASFFYSQRVCVHFLWCVGVGNHTPTQQRKCSTKCGKHVRDGTVSIG